MQSGARESALQTIQASLVHAAAVVEAAQCPPAHVPVMPITESQGSTPGESGPVSKSEEAGHSSVPLSKSVKFGTHSLVSNDVVRAPRRRRG